jgi:hypothetical protein
MMEEGTIMNVSFRENRSLNSCLLAVSDAMQMSGMQALDATSTWLGCIS